MKNRIYILSFSLVLLAIGLVSCEDEVVIYNPDSSFAQLESASASVAEDGDTASITVTSSAAGTVNFTVSSEAGSDRYSITPANGVLEFTEGDASQEIVVTPIDNLDNDGNVEITIELVEGGSLSIGTGGEGLFKKSATVLIRDNDCPTVVSEKYGVRVFAFGEEAPSYTATLVPVAGTDNQFTVASAWGPTFVSWATGDSQYDNRFLYPATITINDDFTVTVVGGGAAYTGGTGTYSACDDEFSFKLTQAIFSSPFTVDVVMTGN